MAREKVKWCENCAMLEKMYLDAKAMHDTQVADIKALREENARLRGIVKGVHGALADAGTVVVPADIDHADLYEPVMQIVREREEARTALAVAEAEHPTGMCLERGLKAERDKLRRDLDRKDHEYAELRSERDEARVERDAAWAVREAAWVQTEDALTRMRTAEAEVKRLEGLILDWYEHADNEPSWYALVDEARRIREAGGVSE